METWVTLLGAALTEVSLFALLLVSKRERRAIEKVSLPLKPRLTNSFKHMKKRDICNIKIIKYIFFPTCYSSSIDLKGITNDFSNTKPFFSFS